MSETTYLSCTETAKLVRAALKEAFPSVKFSVRSKSYAGGASIRVFWTDKPPTEDVEKVARGFQGSRFGVTCVTYHRSPSEMAGAAAVVT